MKLKHMAVVAAAAVVGPTVLTATPAMAQEKPSVTVPDAEPKSDGASTGDQDEWGPKLSLDGLPGAGFKAGGDWSTFTMKVDNSGKKAVSEFSLDLWADARGTLKAKHLEAEVFYGGAWHAAERTPGIDAPNFKLRHGLTIGAGTVEKLQVRMKAAAEAPSIDVILGVRGTNYTSVDSQIVQYATKVVGSDKATPNAPKLSLEGLPRDGFTAGDDTWRTLTLTVDNAGNPPIGEFYAAVELGAANKGLKAGQIQVEALSKTVDGEPFWEPLEVTEENGAIGLLHYGGQYAAGEKFQLTFRVRFDASAPATAFSLKVTGNGNPQTGGPVSQPVSYHSKVAAAESGGEDEVGYVQGPKMTLTGLPGGGFKAGGDWTNLTLALDNTGRADLKLFWLDLYLGSTPGKGPAVKASQVQLQVYGEDEKGVEGWHDAQVTANEDGELSLMANIAETSLAAGDKTAVDLRIRFTDDAPAGAFEFLAYGLAPWDRPTNSFTVSRTDTLTTGIVAADHTGGAGGGGSNQPNPNGGNQPLPDNGNTNGNGNGNGVGGSGAGAGGAGQLAQTGADPAASWALGGAGIALAMGAALVAGTGRRRRTQA